MKNSELLERNYSNHLLTRLEQQRLFLLERDVVRMPCPNCDHRFNLFEGLGIEIDDYDYSKIHTSDAHCPKCRESIRSEIPLMGLSGWFWAKNNP